MVGELRRLDLLPGERWWGGAVADGGRMPFGARPHRRDLATSAGSMDDPTAGANQSAPLLVSSAGRYVWSDRPFAFAFDGAGGLDLDGTDLVVGHEGTTLGAAFRAAASRHFPPAGRPPAPLMFTAPQYNTWIEMPYRPTQEAVLAYADGVLDAGFPPGVLMIDDLWSVDYGTWRFDPATFPDPAAMTRRLHDAGFAVMVWVVPFVSPDSPAFRHLASRGWLIAGPAGEPVVRRWWNGYSAIIDLTHPDAVGWLREVLRERQSLDGVDGFKFDAGDVRDYRTDDVSHGGGAAVDQCEAWARLAAEFPFNELRACWKMGGRPLAQRLHDKPRTWDAAGLGSLIPDGIAQSMIGHPFTCPDMVGGGELTSFVDGAPLDRELFVRFAQCSAMFPMMQFSLAPWRVLDARHLSAVRAAVRTRQALLPDLMRLVADAARTGEPILRPLAYRHPGYETVRDQFMLGDDILCAPVLHPGVSGRRVRVPPGRWRAPDGAVVAGPAELHVPVDLESMPRWRRDPSTQSPGDLQVS